MKTEIRIQRIELELIELIPIRDSKKGKIRKRFTDKIRNLQAELRALKLQLELTPTEEVIKVKQPGLAKKISVKKESEQRKALREQPLINVTGVDIFHVLTTDDLKKIWDITGVKRTLVRAKAMLTARYSIKRHDKIMIYLDVKPSGIYYSTKKV